MTPVSDGAEALPPSHARTSLSMLADTTHVNLLGNVHGGVVMRLVDSTAGAVAQRHSGGPAVTAAMDEMAFLEPVQVGDILRAVAQVNWAGRTSMEIGVRVESEPWNEAGSEPLHVASAYLVGGLRGEPPVTPVTGDTWRAALPIADLEGTAHATRHFPRVGPAPPRPRQPSPSSPLPLRRP